MSDHDHENRETTATQSSVAEVVRGAIEQATLSPFQRGSRTPENWTRAPQYLIDALEAAYARLGQLEHALSEVRAVFPGDVCSECAGFTAEVFMVNAIIDGAQPCIGGYASVPPSGEQEQAQ